MKKIMKSIIVLVAFVCMVSVFVPSKAASQPGPVKNLKVQEHTYFSYWISHRKTLVKAGFDCVDQYDALITWKAATNAKGYKVVLTWQTDYNSYTTTVVVKKLANGTYKYSTKGYVGGLNLIAKNTKDYIYTGTKRQFVNNKLGFFVTGNVLSLDNIRLSKVKIASYNTINGKNIFSRGTTFEKEQVEPAQNFTVKSLDKYVVITSGGVNIRTQPTAGNGSQVIGAALKGQKVHVTGQVYSKKTGKMTDWYRIEWNGVTRYMSKSYSKDDSNPYPTPVKSTMTVTGVTNYLGIRSKMTTDPQYEIGKLNNGDKVKVLDNSNKTYYYVQAVSTGVRGYVLARYLK